MNEKPILFSTEMIKAILDGHKTQTRRVIKPQPKEHKFSAMIMDRLFARFFTSYGDNKPSVEDIKNPYGKPGDLLWVRETWATVSFFDNLKPSAIPKGKYRWPVVWYDSHPKSPSSITKCDHQYIGKRRPSIFMPRWASRITLRVQDVRVERVQDITIDDAGEEGCSNVISGGYDFDIFGENGDYARHPYIMNFHRLWDSINAKRGYSWDSNPWVWVIDFEEVEK